MRQRTFRLIRAGAASALALVPLPVLANATPIAVDISADWTHQLTGIRFPAKLANYQREQIIDFGSDQLDLAANYQQPETQTTITVYLFRAGLADAAVWHDRVRSVILQGRYGAADPAHAISGPFTPSGGLANAGYRTVYPLSGKQFAASGVAAFASGEWLAVFRATSRSLKPADLDAALGQAASAFPLAMGKRGDAAAYGIEACTDHLPEKKARRAEASMMDAILGGAVLQAVEQGEIKSEGGDTAEPSPPLAHWCRDAASNDAFGVYRRGPGEGGYVIALGDAGEAISVYPDGLAGLMNSKAKGQFSVTYATTTMRYNFAPFKAVPTVDQVMAAVQSERPVGSVSRPVGDKKGAEITITAPGH